jgi:P4 family phage/plasmid primase-like protien
MSLVSEAELKTQKNNFKVVKGMFMTFEKFCKEYKNFSNRACFSYDYKQSGSFENWAIALSIINNLPEENRLFNEKIMQNVKVKPYFDIEFMESLLDNEKITMDIDSIKVHIKDKLKLIFMENYDVELESKNILVATCHRDIPGKGKKYSFHIVINSVYVVASSRNARYIADLLRSAIQVELISIVDLSVYKGTQNFRMVGHCKSSDLKSPFLAETNTDLENYIITNIDPEHLLLDTPDPDDYARNYRIKNISKIDFLDDSETMMEIIEKVKDYHPSAVFSTIDAKGFIQFNYTDRSEICFTSDPDNPVTHDKLGFFAYITKNNDICLACHSARCEDLNNKKIVKIVGTKGYNKIKEFKRVHLDEKDFDLSSFDIRDAIFNSAHGLSSLFCKMYQNPNRVKWIDEGKNGTSYFWNGSKWECDGMAFLEHLCVKTLVYVLRDFNNRNKTFLLEDQDIISEEGESESLVKSSQALIKRLNDGGLHSNILKFAKPIINDPNFSDIKDIHPSFLSCKNGMVDLCSSFLRPAVPEDNITKTLETSYDENADSSLFDKFVREITSDINGFNEEKYVYFRYLMGYALHGNPIKKIFVMLYGPHGNNGKSLVMSVINNVLEHYSVTMDKSVVLEGPQKTSGSHSTELVALEHARFGILNDTNEGDAINDGQIKQLTGVTDKISIREIFGKQREIKPIFVPIISSNFEIQMNLLDKAMYNRLIIFPFSLRFTQNPIYDYEKEIDMDLPEKLEKNKAGTLKWLIDAAKFYHNNKDYPIPDFVITERENYSEKVNSYLNFISKNFDKKPESYILKNDLLIYYKEYCKENKKNYIASSAEKEFDNMLTFKNINRKGEITEKKGTKVYYGISYINEDSDNEAL